MILSGPITIWALTRDSGYPWKSSALDLIISLPHLIVMVPRVGIGPT